MTQPFLQLTMDTYVLPAVLQAPRAASSPQPSKIVTGNNGRLHKAGTRTSDGAGANEIIHTSRSSGHRRERDRALRHRRLHVCVLWPVMADPAPYWRDCRGRSTFVSDPIAVEPFAGTAYNAGIRVWPCFVAHLAVAP